MKAINATFKDELAGEWLIANGYFECEEKSGYAFANTSVREAFVVEHYSQDVQRKKDL